jgi:hypothetical protein
MDNPEKLATYNTFIYLCWYFCTVFPIIKVFNLHLFALLLFWLIDWLVFNVQRAIFQLYSGRDYLCECFLTWPIMLSHVTKYSMQKQQILVHDRNLYIILHGNDLELYLIRTEITWAEHWIWWRITSDENSMDFDNASFKYIKATGYDNS